MTWRTRLVAPVPQVLEHDSQCPHAVGTQSTGHGLSMHGSDCDHWNVEHVLPPPQASEQALLSPRAHAARPSGCLLGKRVRVRRPGPHGALHEPQLCHPPGLQSSGCGQHCFCPARLRVQYCLTESSRPHWTQWVLLCTSCVYVPLGHSTHSVAPSATRKRPGSHATQWAPSVMAPSSAAERPFLPRT